MRHFAAAAWIAFSLAWGTGSALADSPEEGLFSGWELSTPTGRIGSLSQAYLQRYTEMPGYQQRLDAELELGLSSDSFRFKAVPWAWYRLPDAQGGLPRRGRVYGDLKEAWAERSGEWLDLRAGNQIFAWGAADQINPTDVWNARDLYDPLVSPKLPIAALMLRIHPPVAEGWTLEAVATPLFRPSRTPLDLPESGSQSFAVTDSRWFLPLPTRVATADGDFTAPLRYQVSVATYPSTWQGGARLRAPSIGGWDFSVSYANGVESLPRFAVTSQGDAGDPALPVVATLHPSFHRQQMFGLDGAGSISLWGSDIGIRFEGAYFARDNSRAEQASESHRKDLLRDDYVHWVAGIDHTFESRILGTILYLNLQYVHYQRLGALEKDPGQYTFEGLPNVFPWDRNLVLYWEDRIGSRSQLRFRGTWITSFVNLDGLLSPAIEYEWTDGLKTSLGADILFGGSNGFYGQFRDNSRASLGAIYSF